METITLQYDASIPGLKGLITSILKLDGVTKVKTAKVSKAAEPEYDPEMVAKIRRGREAIKRGECVTIKASEIWN